MIEFEGRSVVASSSGNRVLLSAWERDVAILDLRSGKVSRSYETTFDAGGDRLALSDEADVILAAAYHVHGLAAYSARTGQERWRRKDLKKIQRIRLSRDGRTAYCGIDKRSLETIDLENGQTINKVRGARAQYDSRCDDLRFIDSVVPYLLLGRGKKKFIVRRTTFAILDVSFAPGRLVLTEAAGPVRCISVDSGVEIWRYRPKQGRHVLHVGYDETEGLLLGIEWPYEKGGAKLLLRWAINDGSLVDSMILGHPVDCVFAKQGSVVVFADGRVVPTGPKRQ